MNGPPATPDALADPIATRHLTLNDRSEKLRLASEDLRAYARLLRSQSADTRRQVTLLTPEPRRLPRIVTVLLDGFADTAPALLPGTDSVEPAAATNPESASVVAPPKETTQAGR